MSTDTQKQMIDREPRHSAFEEFSRDERRPAVLLLSALVIAALFFALGIMVGRWMGQNTDSKTAAPSTNQRPQTQPPVNTASPVSTPSPISTPTPSPSPSPSPSRQPSTRPTVQPSRNR